MSYEPFGWGDRWYDRLGSGVVRPKQFIIVIAIVLMVLVIAHLT